MTTVACDGNTMVADGFITHGEMIVDTNATKVFRLDDGRIAGFAGSGYAWQTIVDYFNDKTPTKQWPKIDSGEMSVLVLDEKGTITMYDHHGRTFNRPAPTAIGTGRQYAMGAMKFGATAEEAVRVACELDTHSGGSLTVMHRLPSIIKAAA